MSHQNGDEYQVGGKLLACPICGQAHFQLNQTLMSTKGANFLGFDWTNPNADTYTCTQCGYILWFMQTIDNKAGHECEIAGYKLSCQICHNTHFWTRETLMSGKGATFMGMDWAERTAVNYICSQCAHILWFA